MTVGSRHRDRRFYGGVSVATCGALAAIFCLAALITGAAGACLQTPAELHAARTDAIYNYMYRTNGDFANYLAQCDRYYADDSALIIRGVGSYQGKSVVEEYGYILFLGIDGVLTVGLGLDPDNATLQWSTSAGGLAAGDVNDTVTFKVNLIFYVQQIPGTDTWAEEIGGLRNTETLEFVPCSDVILTDLSVQDPDVLPLYLEGHLNTANVTCTKIMTRCTGSNTAYNSFSECFAFITALQAASDPRTACPYPLSSNTSSCRDYHADNAWADPVTHCPHTMVDSMVCVDECLPTCASCPANGHCTVYYPSLSIESAIYGCDCDDGYVASAHDPETGSATACAPQECSAVWQCDGGSPMSLCSASTGLCGCADTFTWNSTTGGCDCVDGTVYWSVGSSASLQAPVCVLNGRCLERYQCANQEWDTVQCAQTVPADVVSAFNSCLCNAGFIGGFENPCTCPYGAAAVIWSDIIQGDVCLAPGQCAADWNCDWNSECVFPTDPTTGAVTSPIGVCQVRAS